jgi:uncharacterized membrane protein
MTPSGEIAFHSMRLLASDFVSFIHDPIWPWSLTPIGLPALLLCGLSLVILTVWTYAGTRGGARKTGIVLSLRLAALAVVFLVLDRPTLVSRENSKSPYGILLLADASESMTIQDEFDNQSRWSYVNRLLEDARPLLRTLEEDDGATVSLYGFAEDIRDFDPNGQADGKRTDFGQALRSLYERHAHDRNLRCIIVLSDGADNGTRYPALSEAATWRGVPCPIFTFGVGKTTTAQRQRDIALTGIYPQPSTVAVKGKLTVRGILDAPGFENAAVMVHLLIDDKEVQSRKEVLRHASDNQVTLITDAPSTPGESKVTLKVDPLPGEVSTINNEISTFVTVSKEGLSVLLVDKPRFPEPQLICDALSSDPRIRVYVAWLRGEVQAGELADLFAFEKQHYDAIILGDVLAAQLRAARPDALVRLRDLVARGGTGLMLMGGYETFANGDWIRTPLAELSPVDMDLRGQSDESWKMHPTPQGLSHYIMRLTDSVDSNRLLWEKLPKLDGFTRLGRIKPSATVLAVRGETQDPVLVSQDYGDGRTLAFAGDTTWRWQRLGQPNSLSGVDAHLHFWKQVVFWLAKRDKMEGAVWVKPEARRIAAGAKLMFSTGIRGKGGLDLPEGQFEAKVLGPKGFESAVPVAHENSGDKGTFWKTDIPGEYRVVVRGSGKDVDGQPIGPQEATARFIVHQEDAELLRQAADHDFLAKLASNAGGKFFHAEDFPKFLKDLQRLPLPQAQPKNEYYPDWRQSTLSGFRIALLLVFVGLLCLEWLLRRCWGMV